MIGAIRHRDRSAEVTTDWLSTKQSLSDASAGDRRHLGAAFV